MIDRRDNKINRQTTSDHYGSLVPLLEGAGHKTSQLGGIDENDGLP